MIAEIMTIGDELLIGQVVDTNSAWLGQQLSFEGIRVKQITSVSDDPTHIVEALDAAMKRADIILITGGLGPTKDDLTKKTLRDYFGMNWRMDEQVLTHVEKLFASFGRETTDVNRLQAQVPNGCTVLMNRNGTAPGMWFEKNGKVIVSMPGVPYEMKGIVTDELLPKLRSKFGLQAIVHKTILTQGIGESMLAEKIEAWEDSLATQNIKLAYLPSVGMVRLRMSIAASDKKRATEIVEKKFQEVHPLIQQYIFGYENDTLESVIGKLLLERNQTIGTAESCTGGYISHLITTVAGSSNWYKGSVIAYANDVKTNELGVTVETLKNHGAVSEETVKEMAEGLRKKLKTDYAVSVSGIAGPGGGTEEKPVGTVWIAVAGANGTIARHFRLGDQRERNIVRASLSTLNLVRRYILGEL
jgi:nicotinamide-nucleotide amidase